MAAVFILGSLLAVLGLLMTVLIYPGLRERRRVRRIRDRAGRD